MKSAILFIDTETGGLDPKINPVIQVAWVLEVEGKIVNTDCYDVRPPGDAAIVLDAIKVNDFTFERLLKGKNPVMVMQRLHTAIINTGCRFVICGHNVQFDISMLHAMASKINDNWWFNFSTDACIQLRKPLCTKTMAHYLDYRGILMLPDYKLATLCDHFGIINTSAHDALADVLATRILFHELDDLIQNVKG